MSISKKYLAVKSTTDKVNTLEISVGYEVGGVNMYTGACCKRGYYLYVIPTEMNIRDDGHGRTYRTYSSTMFVGKKMLLKETTRRCSKGSKSEAAILALAEEKEDELVRAVCAEYGYEVDTEKGVVG